MNTVSNSAHLNANGVAGVDPRSVGADTVAGGVPTLQHACMLAYTFYENDGRVMRYAEALVQAGVQVDAIVLGRPGQPREAWLNGVRVLRVQTREKNERGKLTYLWRILQFLFRSMFEVSRQHQQHRYGLVHVHSVPDFEVFAAWWPKLRGAKIILDIHDIVPEFYAAKFGVRHDSWVFKALTWVERASAGFANHVIVANDLWMERVAKRATRRDKCSSMINFPDTTVFNTHLRTRQDDGRFVLSYPGTLNWHQGLDIAIKAFALVLPQAPGMEFHIHGEGPAKPELAQLVATLNLQGKVHLHAPLPLREIAQVMANADVGVVPKRNDAFGGDAFSTKILEFMALGVPVVAAATRVDQHYFNDSLLRFFAPDNEADLARALLDAYQNRARSTMLANNALQHAATQSWGVRKSGYLALVQSLVQTKRQTNSQTKPQMEMQTQMPTQMQTRVRMPAQPHPAGPSTSAAAERLEPLP
jgi:glycosyltransferase involved in cell wall biosynthesis